MRYLLSHGTASAPGGCEMCSCRGGARGSRMVQRHVVRVPHHGRRLTAVKAGHACRADQTLDRPCVVQDHLRVASCLPVRLTTQQFDGPVRHGHARPPASRSSALRFKGRGPSRLARILRSHSAARSVKPTGSPRQVAVVQVRDQNLCRKRPFATHRRGRRPARAGVCRIPCLILCLADVNRVGRCRAPNAPCLALRRSAL